VDNPKIISIINSLVKQVYFERTDQNKIKISTNHFKNGIYFVVVNSTKNKSIQKLIIAD